MKNYFITFFLNNRGEKELSLVKVEDDDSKSKEFPYSVTTYSSSDDSVGYSLVTKFTDNRNFSSNYPISKQLSPGSSFGEFYCVEIPSSMFKAIESLYNELFRAFEDSFERNIGKNKEGLNDGQTSSNDFMKGERVNKSLEVEFVECMDYGVYTFFDFRSEPDSPKILRRGFVNNPRKEAECRKQYQSLSNRAVAELNEIFRDIQLMGI